MDRLVGARKLVAELVKNEQLEVRRAEVVGRDLAKLVETLGRPPSGNELEDWLGEHAMVAELYAGPVLLEELIDRHLRPPPAPPDPASAAEARHPELERQLLEDPERVEAYLVYADWLQEQSDPLGELIALGVAVTRGADEELARFERYLKLHEARFLGGLAGKLGNRAVLRWRNGVVHAIDEVGRLELPEWEALLGLRVCELVQALALHRTCTPELDAALAEHAPASLRALTLEGHSGPLPAHLLRRDLQSLAVIGARIPIGADTFSASLERLELRVFEPIVEGGTPPRLTVRELHVVLTAPLVAFLAGVQLPRLERLTLALDTTEAARLPAVLESLGLPALTHLTIRDGTLDAESFAAFAKLPLAERLASLALVNLELTDAAMQVLAGARGAFPALAEIDVSSNELTRSGLDAARQLAPKVITRRQAKPGAAMERRVRRWAGSRLQVAEGIMDGKAWRTAGVDGQVCWARYRGDAEYELFVTIDLERYGCTCPSSYQPCKHVVALALLHERGGLTRRPSDDIILRISRHNAEHFDSVVE